MSPTECKVHQKYHLITRHHTLILLWLLLFTGLDYWIGILHGLDYWTELFFHSYALLTGFTVLLGLSVVDATASRQ